MSFLLSGFSFDTVESGAIYNKMIGYIRSSGDFWYAVVKHHFGESGRVILPDPLSVSDLDTSLYHRWHQLLSFEYREVKKRKNCSHMVCPFCVRISFDRAVGSYVIKNCVLAHEDHIVIKVSIVVHVKFESNLSEEEQMQLVKFGKMCLTI